MKFKYAVLFVPILCAQIIVGAQSQIVDSLEKLIVTEKVNNSEIYNDLSQKLYFVDSDKAKEYAQRALEKAELVDNQKEIGRSLANIGQAYFVQGQRDTASYYFNKAFDIFSSLKDQTYLALLYRNKADIEFRKYNLDSALVLYESSNQIYNELGDTLGIMKSAHGLANVLKRQRKYEKAYQYLNNELVMANHLNDTTQIGLIYNQKGAIYQEWEKYEKALTEFENAEKCFRAKNYKIGEVTVIHNQAHVLSNLKRYNEALECSFKSLQLFKDLKMNSRIAIAYRSITSIYIKMEKYNDALEYLKKAEALMENNLKQKAYVNMYNYYGEIYFGFKNYLKSAYYFDKALALATELDMQHYAFKVWMRAAKSYSKLNRSDKVIDYLSNYEILADSAFKHETANKLEELEIKYQTEVKEQQIQNLSAEKAQQELTIKNEKQKRGLISILSLLIIVLGGTLSVLYRYKQKQKRIELARTKAEIENRLLRVQMNPHFMFNSLNSVQSYIASNQNELAEDYLARFAQLTRAILNNSREDFILLSNEVETLQTYLELEQQRFNHAFNFSVEIDDEVDEDLLKVPPMLIQPYVENAIIHGVAPLKQNGEIKLSFKPNGKENSLLCVVEDNGIGREASAKINKGSKHKSLGLQVTKERFDLIKQQTGVEVKAGIVDLSDGKGTRVEMVIPFFAS